VVRSAPETGDRSSERKRTAPAVLRLRATPGGTMKMRHSVVQFGKHTVTKSGAPERMRLEVEKTRRAFEIGLGCGLFRVPEVLDFDESKGVAVFERIRYARQRGIPAWRLQWLQCLS
jgi:hypothetical protein